MQGSKKYITATSSLIILILLLFVTAGATAGTTFHAIAYHGVPDSDQPLASDDITLENLVNHFEWLHANGYNPVSVDQLLAAKEGRTTLPEKAVLLCWDDSYKSFYTHVLPLLKAYNYPGVLALVGSWMAAAEGEMVRYGGELVPRAKFLSWNEIEKIAASNLVEIASHSYDLHRGVLADGYGDMLPATIGHKYAPETGKYEDTTDMKERIAGDLKQNSELILEKIGISPRVMVWPFGRYNELAIEAAASVGMEITLTLDPVIASVQELDNIPRIYPTLNPETGSFRYSFAKRSRPPLRRGVHVRTEELIEQDSSSETRFSTLLERVKTLSPGRVYFEPVVEEDGKVLSLFENRYLPTRQDRLLRLSWHTNRRAGAETHITLTDRLFQQVPPIHYGSLLGDMGKAAPCSGLLLASSDFLPVILDLLSEQENKDTDTVWNPLVTRTGRKQLLATLPLSPLKSVLEGVENFQYWQPFLDVGIQISLSAVTEANRGHLHRLLNYFDYVLFDLRQEKDIGEAINKLTQLQNATGQFQYSSVLLERKENDQFLLSRLTKLLKAGIVDYSYSYDDFFNNEPAISAIAPILSTRNFPFVEQ